MKMLFLPFLPKMFCKKKNKIKKRFAVKSAVFATLPKLREKVLTGNSLEKALEKEITEITKFTKQRFGIYGNFRFAQLRELVGPVFLLNCCSKWEILFR